jgi:hypothetical protein
MNNDLGKKIGTCTGLCWLWLVTDVEHSMSPQQAQTVTGDRRWTQRVTTAGTDCDWWQMLNTACHHSRHRLWLVSDVEHSVSPQQAQTVTGDRRWTLRVTAAGTDCDWWQTLNTGCHHRRHRLWLVTDFEHSMSPQQVQTVTGVRCWTQRVTTAGTDCDWWQTWTLFFTTSGTYCDWWQMLNTACHHSRHRLWLVTCWTQCVTTAGTDCDWWQMLNTVCHHNRHRLWLVTDVEHCFSPHQAQTVTGDRC